MHLSCEGRWLFSHISRKRGVLVHLNDDTLADQFTEGIIFEVDSG